MNKHDLIRTIASDIGEKIGTVEAVFAAIESTVKINLGNKEETNLGFAKIKTADKPARMGRNPKTGEKQEIPAKTAVKVVVAKALKDAAAGSAK